MYLRPELDAARPETADRPDQVPSRQTPSEAAAVCFDWAWFVESLGDDETLAAEIVTLFIAESPAMMDRVREAVRTESIEEIRLAAHAFKGAVGNLSRSGPMQTAGLLEQMARSGSVADAPAVLTLLDQQVDSLLSVLESLKLGKDTCAS